MIDTKALKSKVLDLAIQGKLTEQLDSDDDIDVLISNLPEISPKRKGLLKKEFEYNLEINTPEKWRLIELGKISSYGDTPTKAVVSDMPNNTWILELEDIKNGGELICKKRIIESKSIGEKTRFCKGQVLYSKLRPYLKKVLVADEDGISTPELIAFSVFNEISAQYLVYYLTSQVVDKIINSRSYGIKMPRVDSGFMANLPINLPPLAEQKRIVERVEEIFKLLDIIDEAQKKYSADAEILKSKLITMGIQGKLTKQLDSDGTAEELYQQIQEEKQKLIKEGKIKKEKALQPVADEEIPFEIPSNWRWCRFGEILNIVSAKRVHQSDWQTSGVPFYRAREISKLCENGYVNNDLYISEELYKEYSKFGIPKAGDLVISAVGTLGKSYIVKETDKFYYKDASVLCIENIGKISSVFLSYILKSEMMKKQIKSNSTGTTVDTLTMIKLIQYYIPLPPLTEQKRIAHVLDEVLRVIG